MTLIVFLYSVGIALIFVGCEVLFFKKEITLSDRLTTYIFLGSLPAALKSSLTKPKHYQITGKYTKALGLVFIVVGLIIYCIALQNSIHFIDF